MVSVVVQYQAQSFKQYMETVSFKGEELEVPTCLLEDQDVFSHVLSENTWKNVLTEEDRTNLKTFLPGTGEEPDSALQLLFSGENLRFGNPVQQFWEKLHSGSLSPEVAAAQDRLRSLKHHQYKLSQQTRYVHLLRELLLSRQHLLQDALFTGSLENLPSHGDKPEKRRTEPKFTTLLREIRRECGQGDDYMSSDEESVTNQMTDSRTVTEEDYREMLHAHRKRRRTNLKVTSIEQAVRGLEKKQSPDFSRGPLPRRPRDRGHVSSRRARGDKEVDMPRPAVMHRSQRVDGTDMDPDTSRAVYEVYKPLDNTGSTVDPPVEPLRIEGPLPVGRFMSFFSLLKYVFKDILDGKGELNKLMKNVRHALKSPDVSTCGWVKRRPDWPAVTLSAICYLGAEVGAVSSFSPLPHFIPVIEFRDRIDHWKWIGNGRDSDVELMVLCNHWLENIKKTLPVVDYSEYEPPPPHVWTNFSFRPSSQKEILKFRQLERERYASPQKSFTYSVHGFEAPVGPVKGSRSTKKEASSKARGHALLIAQRPTCVTILSLVRDATSRLPNGEGTRIDLCVLVQDSQYLANNVSDTQLNNAVSGALDRLHYEKDPCVRYDGSRKVWIYLHRGRNEDDFERIFWACEVAANQRKRLMCRPRIKPKIIMSVDGREVVLDQGGAAPPTDEPPVKVERKHRGRGMSSSGVSAKAGTVRSGAGMVTATLIPSDDHMTAASVARQTGTGSSTDKPKRKRKPSQKLAEQQQKAKRLPPPLTALPSTSLGQSSDWASSGDEDQVLPFLDSSLMSTEDKLSQDSASSWHSSDSGGEDGVAIATESNPGFSVPTRQISSGLLQSSPVTATPTFMTETSNGGSARFVTLTPTQNFLPSMPTVATPTFIPDIGIGDEGDVLGQQLGEKTGGWLSSGSTTPE